MENYEMNRESDVSFTNNKFCESNFLDDEIMFKKKTTAESSDGARKLSYCTNKDEGEILVNVTNLKKLVSFEEVNEPHFCIKRTLFGCGDITDFENNKLALFKREVKNDKNLNKKIESCQLEDFYLNFILNNDENILRLLNMFNYDVYKTIHNLNKLFELIKKLKLPSDIFKTFSHSEIEESLIEEVTENISSFYLFGKDKFSRPIIAIEANKMKSDILKFPDVISFFHSITIFLNSISLKDFKKGVVEQFTLFLDILDCQSESSNDVIYELIKLIQYLYPSRLDKIIVIMSKKSVNLFTLINKSFCPHNLEKVEIFNKKKIESLTQTIPKETLYNFFVYNKRTVSNNLNYVKNTKISFSSEREKGTLISENHKDFMFEMFPSRLSLDQGKILYNIETDSHTNEGNTFLSRNMNNISWSQSVKVDKGDLFTIVDNLKPSKPQLNFQQSEFSFTIQQTKPNRPVHQFKDILIEKDVKQACCDNECRII